MSLPNTKRNRLRRSSSKSRNASPSPLDRRRGVRNGPRSGERGAGSGERGAGSGERGAGSGKQDLDLHARVPASTGHVTRGGGTAPLAALRPVVPQARRLCHGVSQDGRLQRSGAHLRRHECAGVHPGALSPRDRVDSHNRKEEHRAPRARWLSRRPGRRASLDQGAAQRGASRPGSGRIVDGGMVERERVHGGLVSVHRRRSPRDGDRRRSAGRSRGRR